MEPYTATDAIVSRHATLRMDKRTTMLKVAKALASAMPS